MHILWGSCCGYVWMLVKQIINPIHIDSWLMADVIVGDDADDDISDAIE